MLFMKSLSENTKLSGDNNGITAAFSCALEPNEEKFFRLIIGYSFEHEYSKVENIFSELAAGEAVTEPRCAFAED